MSPSLSNSLSNPEPLARLQKLRGNQTEPDPAVIEALNLEGMRRARSFMSGIRAYQHHPAQRDVEEMPIIWRKGTTVLRDYNPHYPTAPIILVIPSLINRFDILDLDSSLSFLRSLAGHGFRPLVVDWDTPGEAEKNFTLHDYIANRLQPILNFTTATQGSCHIMGYCMGGLLALALAAQSPDQIKTMTLMATPWDFHRPDPGIGEAYLHLANHIEPMLQASGAVSVDVIQSLFASFQPLRVLEKFGSFDKLDPASTEARHFVLLEDWLNDGVPLTANVARECFRDWYGENCTAKQSWHVGSMLIDPGQVTTPSYVIVPGKDYIVPPESALPLARLLPHATLHEPMMGHVGLMSSRQAPQQVWAPLMHWLDQHN